MRWRSTEDVGREEGLNELGEAPPAYVAPRKSGETSQVESATVTVPMEALTREGVGLKPPDYTPARTTAVTEQSGLRLDESGEGSSRPRDGER
jgi:hypothetical protein